LGPLKNAAYEFKIFLLVYRLFGAKKAVLFLFGALAVLDSKANRNAYRFLGVCRTRVFGGNVILPHPEPRFIDEIVMRRCYTPNRRFEIGNDMIVVDAGANVGMFTIYAASRARNGKVIAIEPDPQTFAYLEENVLTNGFGNVVLLNAALAAKPGTEFLSGVNPGSKTIMARKKGRLTGTTVTAVTLENVISRFGLHRIDLLKVDIEGAEFLLFDDTSWFRITARIVMEAHPNFGDLRHVVEKLTQYGYEVCTTGAYGEDTRMLYAFNCKDFSLEEL